MPDYREDPGAYPVMVDLAAQVQKEIVKSGLDPIDKVTLQPGIQPVSDYAGNKSNCGEIIVNMTSAFATDAFPDAVPTATCSDELAFVVTVWVLRCAAPMGGTTQQPKPPSPEAQLASTRDHLADMQAVRRAIVCTFRDMDRQYVVGNFTPWGPSGNVVGGYWTVTFSEK